MSEAKDEELKGEAADLLFLSQRARQIAALREVFRFGRDACSYDRSGVFGQIDR